MKAIALSPRYSPSTNADCRRTRLFAVQTVARSPVDVTLTSMSDTFTSSSPSPRLGRANTFQNNDLSARIATGHDSCIGTPRKPASHFGKGSIRHHGLDLVDRLGVPYRRLRRHAARRVSRAGAEGEGTRLVDTSLRALPAKKESPLPAKRSAAVLSDAFQADRQRHPLHSIVPMSKNEDFRSDGRGQLMAEIAPSRNFRVHEWNGRGSH